MLRTLLAADRRAQFEQLEYTEDDYQKELEHIEKVPNISLFSVNLVSKNVQYVSLLA
jgi:hypothetical protein